MVTCVSPWWFHVQRGSGRLLQTEHRPFRPLKWPRLAHCVESELTTIFMSLYDSPQAASHSWPIFLHDVSILRSILHHNSMKWPVWFSSSSLPRCLWLRLCHDMHESPCSNTSGLGQPFQRCNAVCLEWNEHDSIAGSVQAQKSLLGSGTSDHSSTLDLFLYCHYPKIE